MNVFIHIVTSGTSECCISHSLQNSLAYHFKVKISQII